MQSSGVQSVSSLKEAQVWSPTEDRLGHIDEIMIHVNTGRIAYAVLSFAGFLGFRDKLFAVPWAVLKPKADGDSFILDVAREVLEEALVSTKTNGQI
jgi:sporulation protein YlmC with PRC-barrel domain